MLHKLFIWQCCAACCSLCSLSYNTSGWETNSYWGWFCCFVTSIQQSLISWCFSQSSEMSTLLQQKRQWFFCVCLCMFKKTFQANRWQECTSRIQKIPHEQASEHAQYDFFPSTYLSRGCMYFSQNADLLSLINAFPLQCENEVPHSEIAPKHMLKYSLHFLLITNPHRKLSCHFWVDWFWLWTWNLQE